MKHPHTKIISGTVLTPGAKISRTSASGSKFTVYVSKKPIRDLGFGRGLYKILEVWNKCNGRRYIYDRQTSII